MSQSVPRSAIVVGAGTAGSIVARRLADAGVGVVVLEAGGDDANPAIHNLARQAEIWHSDDDWDYHTVPQEHAADRELHLPRGKVLGGSHALNAMIWVRGAAADYDGWAAEGNDGWSWSDVRPVFDRIEAFSGPSPHRGHDGLLDVTDDYPLTDVQRAIMDAANAEGLPVNPDYNDGDQDGVSQEQVTIRDGERFNTYMAYLRPVIDAVDVRVGCWVHELLVEPAGDEPRVVGVRYEQDGRVHEVRADEVVLCAGALDSPRILLRSGLGPADEVASLGIESVVDLPGVGKNLHDHWLAPVVCGTSRRIGPPADGVSPTQTHIFWRSRPGLSAPDTQPINFSVPMYQEDMTGPDDGFSLMAGLIRPRSRGSVTLGGPGPHDGLTIDPHVLEHPDDVTTLVASVEQCRRIAAQAPLADEWGAYEVYPGESVTSEGLADYVRSHVVTYHHQCGTCRMGSDPHDAERPAVVDARLAVHGVSGLRVADASIIPTITSGNTNAPTAMIGERAADFILG